MHLPCACCSKEVPVNKFPHSVPAGIIGQWHPALELLRLGAWRKCVTCVASESSQNASSSCVRASSVAVVVPRGALLRCYRCGVEQGRAKFDLGALQNLHERDELWRAVCLQCDPSHLRTNITNSERRYRCVRCEVHKPVSAFNVTEFKRHSTQQWRRRACQEETLLPACGRCGRRPQKQLVQPKKEYICDACRYPKCDRCGSAERPRNGKYSITVMPAWTCRNCRPSPRNCSDKQALSSQ